MWSQHLGHLAALAFCLRKDNSAKVPANLLWTVLNLDVQLCLAGNNDAGSYVRAYLADESFLPDLAELQNLRHDFKCGTSALCAAVYDLATYICRKFAELSQLALKMRSETNSGRGSAAARHRCIDKFYHLLYIEWTFRYKHILTLTASDRNLLMGTTISATFGTCKLEFYSSDLHGGLADILTRLCCSTRPSLSICTQACITINTSPPLVLESELRNIAPRSSLSHRRTVSTHISVFSHSF